jgi:dTDP-4-dehydrorhamnose reductase
MEGGHRGVFHVTNRGICSWYAFAVKIVEYAGLHDVTLSPAKTEILGRPAARPPFSGLSGKKFVDATGKILRVWQMALRDFMDHLSQPHL